MTFAANTEHFSRRAAAEDVLRDAADDRCAEHAHGAMADLYRRVADQARTAGGHAADRARAGDWESEGGSVVGAAE